MKIFRTTLFIILLLTTNYGDAATINTSEQEKQVPQT
jgi:hypothetical protein